MLNTLKQMLGLGPKTDYRDLMKQGAIIVDVRTKSEFSSGHIKGSVNIPLNQISSANPHLRDKSKPIITCCASGMRSSSALHQLKTNGFKQVYNGGSWASLQEKIK